jgi:hypothetical protein
MVSQNSEFKYGYDNTHLDLRGYQYRSDTRDRKNSTFFRSPYLEIDKTLVPVSKLLQVGTQRHLFNTIIWGLNVKNNDEHRFKLRQTTSALDCIPNIHFKSIGQRVPLRWRMYKDEPNECATTNLPDTAKNEYVKLLGFYYAKEMLADSCGVNQVSLNPGDIQQIYFLFTFQESRFAYIISPIEATWYGNEALYCSVSGAFLFLEIPGEYEFVIWFDWEKHTDINGKSYSIRLDSWDRIFMSRC